MEEFIYLKKATLILKEYALKFSLLAKCAPTFVANSRDLMNWLMMGVSELVEEECCMVTLVNYMYM